MNMGHLTATLTSPRVGMTAAAVLALAVLCATPAPAVAQTASGTDVKAAFLLNFSKFIEWPTRSAGPFVIGVLGDDEMTESLRSIVDGKSIGGRPLVARRVSLKDNLADLQVLFIGVSESARLTDVLKRTEQGHVLTVSDQDRFCQQGGIIQFRSERDRIRFDINLDQAERAKLMINSKLLALAKTVHQATKTTESRDE